MAKVSENAVSSDPVDRRRPPTSGWYGEYDEAGVDLSLLRWFLRLTPLERLVEMERLARDTLVLAEYGRRHREA